MDIVVVIILIILAANYLINYLSNNSKVSGANYLWLLFTTHFVLTIAYMLYAASSASDSVAYYYDSYTAEAWFNLWDTGTSFIKFLAWPLTHQLGLSYYAVMLIFSFIGFVAVVFFYMAARENIKLPATLWNLTLIELVFLLPNLHFWTSSLGKGSIITFGLGLFAYGLSRFNRRILPLVLGSALVFMIRPHIFLTLVLSTMLGLLITTSGIKNYLRWIIFLIAGVLFYFISDDVVKFAEVESINILSSSKLEHQASELGKATTGVDINNYGLGMKLFTFWFRPLFLDSGGFIGIFASLENVLYLFMFIVVIRKYFLYWTSVNGWFRISLFVFLFGSLILAQVTGNLGAALRQKAQIMPFFFIVYLKAVSFQPRLGRR